MPLFVPEDYNLGIKLLMGFVIRDSIKAFDEIEKVTTKKIRLYKLPDSSFKFSIGPIPPSLTENRRETPPAPSFSFHRVNIHTLE